MGMPDLVDDLHRVRVRVLNLLLGGSKKRKSLMIFLFLMKNRTFLMKNRKFFVIKKCIVIKFSRARPPASQTLTQT